MCRDFTQELNVRPYHSETSFTRQLSFALIPLLYFFVPPTTSIFIVYDNVHLTSGHDTTNLLFITALNDQFPQIGQQGQPVQTVQWQLRLRHVQTFNGFRHVFEAIINRRRQPFQPRQISESFLLQKQRAFQIQFLKWRILQPVKSRHNDRRIMIFFYSHIVRHSKAAWSRGL